MRAAPGSSGIGFPNAQPHKGNQTFASAARQEKGAPQFIFLNSELIVSVRNVNGSKDHEECPSNLDRKSHQGGSAFLVSYLSKEHQAYDGIIWPEQTKEELAADFGAEVIDDTIPIIGVSDLPVIVYTTKGCGNWQPGRPRSANTAKQWTQVRGVQWCIVAAGTYYGPGSFGRSDCSGESTEL